MHFSKTYGIPFQSYLLFLQSRYQSCCFPDISQHCPRKNCPSYLACIRRASQKKIIFISLIYLQTLNDMLAGDQVNSCQVPCCSLYVMRQMNRRMQCHQAAASNTALFLVMHGQGGMKCCKQLLSCEKRAHVPYHYAGVTETSGIFMALLAGLSMLLSQFLYFITLLGFFIHPVVFPSDPQLSI